MYVTVKVFYNMATPETVIFAPGQVGLLWTCIFEPTHTCITYTLTHQHTSSLNIYTPTHIHTNTPTHLHTNTPAHLLMYSPKHQYIYLRTHLHTNTTIYIHTYSPTHQQIYQHTYTPTHLDTNIPIQTLIYPTIKADRCWLTFWTSVTRYSTTSAWCNVTIQFKTFSMLLGKQCRKENTHTLIVVNYIQILVLKTHSDTSTTGIDLYNQTIGCKKNGIINLHKKTNVIRVYKW